jgi:hypothetical protein
LPLAKPRGGCRIRRRSINAGDWTCPGLRDTRGWLLTLIFVVRARVLNRRAARVVVVRRRPGRACSGWSGGAGGCRTPRWKAPDNRHEERNERVLRRRSSEVTTAPSHALATREGAAKRWQGCTWAGGLSLEMFLVWDADALIDAEGNIVGCGIASGRRVPRGQRACARVRSLHAENREISWPPVVVMAGRAAQGTHRRYA